MILLSTIYSFVQCTIIGPWSFLLRPP